METKEAKSLSKNAEYLLKTRYLYKDNNTGMIIRERMTFVDGKARARHEVGDKIAFNSSEDIDSEITAEGKHVYTDENVNGDYLVNYRLAIREKTFEDMCRRVARYVALAEFNYTDDVSKVREVENKFYDMLHERIFFPNSPTLFNAGKGMMDLVDEDYVPILNKETISDNEYTILYNYWESHPEKVDGMLSACFVLPIEDSMEGITDTLKETALILKAGGGVGFNFSNLRPKGAPVKGTAGYSSGPISFMKLFNETGAVVEQGGRRRAALMGSLDVTHPDVEQFIECKKDNDGNSVLNYFNISVNIDDHEGFLEAYRNNESILLEHKGKKLEINARGKCRTSIRNESVWRTIPCAISIM
jgi:ribonucleoside-diphosphate reductase alpha chain